MILNCTIMIDSARGNYRHKTISTVKRRHSSMSCCRPSKQFNFGSLLELIRVWKKQVKNKKNRERTHKDTISELQQPPKTAMQESAGDKQDKLVPTKNSVFRVRFSQNCERFKSLSPRKKYESKIGELQVQQKAISGRTDKLERQIDVMRNVNALRSSNERWAVRRGNLERTSRPIKEAFEEDFRLTPW